MKLIEIKQENDFWYITFEWTKNHWFRKPTTHQSTYYSRVGIAWYNTKNSKSAEYELNEILQEWFRHREFKEKTNGN